MNDETKHEMKVFSKQYHRRKPQMSLLVDIQAKLFNLKQMAAAMNFIETHNIRSYE